MYCICGMLGAKKTNLEMVPHMYDKARVCKIKHENDVGLDIFEVFFFFLSFLLAALFYFSRLKDSSLISFTI